jgi:divalent metal cation (Fe/Co/Zn/Cd) transporter
MFQWTPRRAEQLERAAAAWNIFEAGLSLAVGASAGAVSLIAFGLASGAELAATVIALRELRHGWSVFGHRLLGAMFALVGVTALAAGVYAFTKQSAKTPGAASIMVATLCTTVMLLIAMLQFSAGRALRNRSLTGHGKLSIFDALIGGGVMMSLVAWSAFGFTWVDGTAAVLVGIFSLFEGVKTYRSAATPEL